MKAARGFSVPAVRCRSTMTPIGHRAHTRHSQAQRSWRRGSLRGRYRAVRVPPRSPRSGWCAARSEEHTSELQSLMRISYAVFCLKKKNTSFTTTTNTHNKAHIEQDDEEQNQ